MKSSAAGYYPKEDHGGGNGVVPDMQWRMAVAWQRLSGVLISRIDEIEWWVRLMVPDLTSRISGRQYRFAEWLSNKRQGKRYEDEEGVSVGRAAEAEMKEMVSVFLEANRLRRSVLAEIVSAMDVYQAAAFFKALAQFIVGRDKDVVEKLEQCMVMLQG